MSEKVIAFLVMSAAVVVGIFVYDFVSAATASKTASAIPAG
jgi:hypothetical protein